MADTLADILGVKGFEVHSAYSGAEALEILREHPVDILLTDVRMPDMNGVELYLETKKTRPALTTILMTAYAADDIIHQGVAEGENSADQASGYRFTALSFSLSRRSL